MSQKNKGIFFMILSAFSFSLMNLFVKMAGDVPSTQKSLVCYVVLSVFCTVSLMRKKISIRWNPANTGVLLARSVFGCAAVVCHYYALGHMNVADASILNKMSPFFVTIACFFMLGESMRPMHFICMGIAFVGSMFIVKPVFDFTAMLPAIVAFLGAITTGVGYAFLRICGLKGEPPARTVCIYSIFTVVSLIPFVALNYKPMEPVQIFFLVLAGLSSMSGQICVSCAYLYAEAKEVSVFNYLNPVFAGIWSFLVWHTLPDGISLIGYVIVFGGAYMMYLYNLKASRKLQKT